MFGVILLVFYDAVPKLPAIEKPDGGRGGQLPTPVQYTQYSLHDLLLSKNPGAENTMPPSAKIIKSVFMRRACRDSKSTIQICHIGAFAAQRIEGGFGLSIKEVK